jgi:hypothetical protein
MLAGRPSAAQLSDKAVWRLLRVAAEGAGLEGWECLSGHSLRAGLTTAAGEAGADLAQVMRRTRHRSAEVACSSTASACGSILGGEAWSAWPTLAGRWFGRAGPTKRRSHDEGNPGQKSTKPVHDIFSFAHEIVSPVQEIDSKRKRTAG